MHRKRVLLLFGGESSEHDVSVVSARNVYAALDDRKYDITLGYITKEGTWRLVENIDQLHGHSALVPVLGGRHFAVQPGNKTVVPEVILPILHGTNGEDGAVQGLAKLMHIPIVGCQILSSAICMDKEISKKLLHQADIPVADYVLCRAGQDHDFANISLKLGNPVFVKPANQGSSVGVSKVYNESGFKDALNLAFKYDRKVLVEQAINGREVECAVLGNDDPEASVVGEIKPEGDFYSYESKYSSASKSEVVIPADLPEDVAANIRELAIKAYKVMECSGLARVDFFVTADNKIYLNELNTMPGFTNISMYPKLWRASGLGYPQLIDKLIELAT